MAISELDFNIRTISYTFIALSCFWCFANLKNFHPQKNLGFILANILCLLIVVADFMFQFSIIGKKGWVATGSYQNCFNFSGNLHNQALHDKICNVFKLAYYLNALVYLTSLASFAVYLLATSKLLKLVSHDKDGKGYRARFEDEVETEN